MPTLTETVADLPLALPTKLRLLRALARTGYGQGRLRSWAAGRPGLVTGPDWQRRAWWGLAAGEVVREHLFDVRRRAQALALVDDDGWSHEIDAARREGGVVLVAAHVGPPKLLMNVLLGRTLPLLVWTNTGDMPEWLPGSTTATLLDPLAEAERSALLVRSALHLKRGGVLLGAADHPTGARVITHRGLGLEWKVSLGLPALCRRLRTPAFLVAALWRGNRVRVEATRLPEPDASLGDDAWDERWADGYRAGVERAMRSGPENLRILRGVDGGALARAIGVGGARGLRPTAGA